MLNLYIFCYLHIRHNIIIINFSIVTYYSELHINYQLCMQYVVHNMTIISIIPFFLFYKIWWILYFQKKIILTKFCEIVFSSFGALDDYINRPTLMPILPTTKVKSKLNMYS